MKNFSVRFYNRYDALIYSGIVTASDGVNAVDKAKWKYADNNPTVGMGMLIKTITKIECGVHK